jgi:hypothetical protein
MGEQNNCNTCFITGAGFSAPAKLPIQSKLLQNIKDRPAELEYIQNIFKHKKDDDIFKDVALEDVFTFLDKIIYDNGYVSAFDVTTAYKAKRDLIKMFITDINKALKPLRGEDKYSYFFDRIVKRKLDGETNTIITFNWDTIPDFYINRAYKDRGEKCGVDYGCYDWDWDEKVDFVPSIWRKPKGYSTVKVLKLHGSINWAYSRNKGELYVKEQLSAYPEGLIIEDDDKFKEYDYIFMTPTFIKDLSNVHTKLIWHNASFDLAGAKRLVFLGCSLPQADYEARYLLLKTAVQNKGIKIRVLIYPGESEEVKKETKKRFRTLFVGHDLKFEELDIKNFLEDTNLIWDW